MDEGNDPYAQIAAGVVPDATKPFHQSEEADPYAALLQQQEPAKQEAPKETPKQEAPKPQPGLSARVEKNVKAPAVEPDWLQFLHKTPVVGDVTRGAEQVIQNAGQAGREFQKDPVSAGMAALGGAASGATGAVEAPAALGTNALANLLIPNELRTKRVFPGQVAGTPEAQASQVLQQAQAARPPQYSYAQGVKGDPYADRIARATQKNFPNEKGSVATGQVVGGFAPVLPGVGAAEGAGAALFSNLVKNPKMAKAVEIIAHHATNHPLARVARGAGEGAAIGEGYHLGDQAAHGQPLKPSAVPALGGALIGGATHGIGVTGRGKSEAPAETAKVEAPKVERKVLGQVVKPKAAVKKEAPAPEPQQFNSFNEAYEALQKNPDNQAAIDYIYQGRTGFGEQSQVQIPKREEPVQEEAQTQASETHVPQEETPTTTNPKLQALYEKTGKRPVEESELEEPAENIHEAKQRVPIDEVKEYNPETKSYTKPFDTSHGEPRRVKWRGETYGAVPHGEEGYVTMGGSIGARGAARQEKVFANLKAGTSVPQQLLAKKFSDIQQHANERGLQEAAEGRTPKAQAEALQKAHDKQVAAINNDDLEALEKAAKSSGNSGILYSQVVPITPIIDIAKFTGKKLPEVARSVYGDKWVDSIKNFAKFRRTLDIIEQHTPGDNLVDKLWGNLANEMLNTRDAKFESNQAGEVQDALRSLTPEQILDPENTPNWTEAQREAIASQKIIRQDTRQLIKGAVEKYGDEVHPELRQALDDYSASQFGKSRTMPNSEVENMIAPITQASYDYLFRWNPKFHALNLTDPIMAGSSRVGVGNIMKSYALMRNPEIKDYLGSFRIKGEHAYMRDQIHAQQTGLAKTLNTPLKIGKFSTEHDIPSEEVNERVMMLAGLLEHGERVYGRGKGEQFVKDMAAGKVDPEQQLDAMVDALKATNDAVGGGTFGMNKDMVQRSNLLKNFAQFSTQQVRIARLISKYIREKQYGKLNTFIAATIALGGSAIIPKEIEPTLQKLNPEAFYSVKTLLDSFNLPKKVGVDLTDKLKLATINWGTNAGIEDLGKLATKWFGGDKNFNLTEAEGRRNLTSFLGDLMMVMPITVKGIGGSVPKRAITNLMDLAEGKKKVYAYPSGGQSNSYPLGKGTMDYGFWDYLYDQLVPGSESRVQNFVEKKREISRLKKLNAPIPKNLDEQYPSPGIKEGTDS